VVPRDQNNERTATPVAACNKSMLKEQSRKGVITQMEAILILWIKITNELPLPWQHAISIARKRF